MYNWSINKQHTHSNKGVSIANSIHHSNHIYNYFKTLNLGLFLSDVYLNHLMTIILSVFLWGYRGKTVDFQEVSHCHRTTTAYFLNHGKWNDIALQDTLKKSILHIIYREAQRSEQPVYSIVDDAIASHTRPSSQALHPIEAAYFHQSYLKDRQDYGHQVVSVMLSCNGITLNYAVILYDKSKSKIQIVKEIAEDLPIAPVVSYFLCDSWYTSSKVMDSFIRKGFYTIGALKTNHILYPWGIPKHCGCFSLRMSVCQLWRYWRLISNGGRSNYFSVKAKVNWHWINISSAPVRKSKDIGWLCRWFIFCVACILEAIVLLKKVMLFYRNSSQICTGLSKVVLQLKLLWS